MRMIWLFCDRKPFMCAARWVEGVSPALKTPAGSNHQRLSVSSAICPPWSSFKTMEMMIIIQSYHILSCILSYLICEGTRCLWEIEVSMGAPSLWPEGKHQRVESSQPIPIHLPHDTLHCKRLIVLAPRAAFFKTLLNTPMLCLPNMTIHILEYLKQYVPVVRCLQG